MAKQERNWNEIVANSEGQVLFVPEEFIDEAKKLEKLRLEVRKDLTATSKKDTERLVQQDNFFLKIRKHLEKNGDQEIWNKDVGFNLEALKEGKFIINIIEEQRR